MIIQDAIELIFRIIINFLDIVMIYYLCHNLINRKPKLKALDVCLWIVYGLVAGGIFFYFGEGALFRSVFIISITLFLKHTAKKKFLSDILVLYTLILLIVGITQNFAFIFVISQEVDKAFRYIVGQLLNTGLLIVLYKNLKLYKVFNYINERIVFKTALITVLIFFWLVFAWFSANREELYKEELYIEVIQYMTVSFIIIFAGIYQLSKNSDGRIRNMPKEIHDTKKTLRALYTELAGLDEGNPHKQMMQIIEVKYPNAVVNNLAARDPRGNVLKFVESWKNGRNVVLNTDLIYVEPNPCLSLSLSLEMLETLLDNAIETKTEKPINVYYFMAQEEVEIRVSNECDYLFPEDFDKMFSEGYSTKGDGRGYGLPNLVKAIEKLGGDLKVKMTYDEEQKCNYLLITIHVKTYKKQKLFRN